MEGVVHDLEFSKAVLIQIRDAACIEVDLISPHSPKGLVLLIHGSGSSRLSPRNRYVARVLRERCLATALLDIETAAEKSDRENTGLRAVELSEMVERILITTDWFGQDEHVRHLPIGYYGTGTGAAAAFIAAAKRPEAVRTVVARGGRLELADEHLPRVQAPALLIVGAHDLEVVHHNWDALDRLSSPIKKLEVIPGAQHMFEEPGALAAAALHASGWFAHHLPDEAEHLPVHAVVHGGP
ncbi:MAG TPA: dienelactone hydrolase family protein [Fimbriimonadaceae bacterium]|nr:dienelactone hydrolase family protein [Fimbriimonadaceae bacterium]